MKLVSLVQRNKIRLNTQNDAYIRSVIIFSILFISAINEEIDDERSEKNKRFTH